MASAPADASRPVSPRFWTPGRTARATIVFAAVAAVFVALYFLQAAVFCLFVGVILATALRRPIAWLERRGCSHGTGVLIVFAILGIVLLGALGLGIPLIATQAVDLRDKLPNFYGQARQRMLDSTSGLVHQLVAHTSNTLPSLDGNTAKLQAHTEFLPPALRYFGDVLPNAFLFVAVLMLAFYWALQEDRTLRAMLLLVPVQRRDSARELIEAIQKKVGDYVFGQATVCLVIGVLTFIAYTLIGLPHALPLAILSGLLETVPVFGLLTSALPAALVALAISGGKFFGVVVAITIIHLSDNFFISPKIMGRSVGLHPIVTLLALVGFGELFGLPGAVLAILLASIAQLLMDRLLLSREAQAAAPIEGRDHLSLLRREAQEVLQDVRLSSRRKEEDTSPTNDRFEEEIETIATELERMLSEEYAERAGATDAIEAAR